MPGGCPPRPPLLVMSRAIPPFFVLKNFWANERDNIFGEGVKNYKKPHQTNGGLSSTCKHVRA